MNEHPTKRSQSDDLIRRSDALEAFAESTSAMPEKQGRRRIEEIPAVDAVEKRHGAWVVSSTEHTFSDGTKARWNIWKCSRCPYVRTAGWEYTTEGQKPKARFCESCGAKMGGEETHNAAD